MLLRKESSGLTVRVSFTDEPIKSVEEIEKGIINWFEKILITDKNNE